VTGVTLSIQQLGEQVESCQRLKTQTGIRNRFYIRSTAPSISTKQCTKTQWIRLLPLRKVITNDRMDRTTKWRQCSLRHNTGSSAHVPDRLQANFWIEHFFYAKRPVICAHCTK